MKISIPSLILHVAFFPADPEDAQTDATAPIHAVNNKMKTKRFLIKIQSLKKIIIVIN